MKSVLLMAGVVWAAGWAAAQTPTNAPLAPLPATNCPALAEAGADFGFAVGEELQYRVYWGVIPVGSAVITTSWEDQPDGRRLLLIRYRAKSNKVLATLYPVDDIIECRIDPKPFLPVAFMKALNEGRYWTREKTEFDHAARKATWRSFDEKWATSDRQESYDIEADTRDFVSFMYFTRRERWVPNETRAYRVMADDKIYELLVHTGGLEEVEAGAFGKVRSLRIDPEAKFHGLFIRKGKARMWVSDDDRRICPRAEASVPIASIWAVLDKVYGPGADSWIRKTRELDRTAKDKL